MERYIWSTGMGIVWTVLTFLLGAVQIVIAYIVGFLQKTPFSSITKACLSDGSFLFFFQALVFSLIVEYAFNKKVKIANQFLSAMLYVVPIMLLLFSLVLHFERLYDPKVDMDLYYSIELLILVISGFYAIVVKAIFNFKDIYNPDSEGA